jgi:predicted nucleic acid-binding Zn finger protein
MLFENNVIKSILKRIEEERELKEELIEELKELFPDKIEKTLEILNKGIIQYTFFPSKRKVWAAVGSKNDLHLIYPGLYCDCIDFYKNVAIDKKNTLCKHLLAQLISFGLKNFEEVSLNDEDFNNFIKQFKF